MKTDDEIIVDGIVGLLAKAGVVLEKDKFIEFIELTEEVFEAVGVE